MRTAYAAFLLLTSTLFAASASAAPVFYGTRAAFLTQVGASVTDDYSNSGYAFIQTNAAMSAVLGETDYLTTGHLNNNIVFATQYCAGCNGSFLLTFTSTSVGGPGGVFGVGLDITFNSTALPYHAFITYGDSSTQDVLLSAGIGFLGVTSDLDLRSIHFGLANGGATIDGSFAIDNLTIGRAASNVPEPASIALVAVAFAAMGATRRRKLSCPSATLRAR